MILPLRLSYEWIKDCFNRLQSQVKEIVMTPPCLNREYPRLHHRTQPPTLKAKVACLLPDRVGVLVTPFHSTPYFPLAFVPCQKEWTELITRVRLVIRPFPSCHDTSTLTPTWPHWENVQINGLSADNAYRRGRPSLCSQCNCEELWRETILLEIDKGGKHTLSEHQKVLEQARCN